MNEASPPTICWRGDAGGGAVEIIDQTLLPQTSRVLELTTVEGTWEAIKMLRIRGAPAIGVAAAMGVVLGLRERAAPGLAEAVGAVGEVADYLATSRPTAVNLFWALGRMREHAETYSQTAGASASGLLESLLAEAEEIRREDAAMCRAIGEHGSTLFPTGAGVLTHCNAGSLATAEFGTALGCIRSAHAQGKRPHVYADETRPLLQGARLTTYELMRDGIETTLICDSMAAHAMKLGRIDLCIVGADRIAANGDTANKIGTYSVALAAAAHDIPFYVAAPCSTFDLSLASGDEIPIEERAAEEVTEGFGTRTAPPGVSVFNPAFDVTPARLIRAIITERGIIDAPTTDAIEQHFAGQPMTSQP